MHDILQGQYKKVQVGNDRKRCSRKEIPTPKTEMGKKLNWQLGTYTRKHIISRVSSYFPIGGHSVTQTVKFVKFKVGICRGFLKSGKQLYAIIIFAMLPHEAVH